MKCTDTFTAAVCNYFCISFLLCPPTVGLSVLIAIMETLYVRSGDETYQRMAKFWGNLLLINFAMGVVTGIVMEFQFGMNWGSIFSLCGGYLRRAAGD